MTDVPATTLRPALRTWNLILFGIVAMAPIAGVTMYGFVAALSGGAVIPAYLLAGAGVGLTAMSFAAMAEAAPGAGSVYGYASHAMGRFMGFLGGWAILLDYLLLTALVIVFGAYYLTGALPWLPLNVATGLFGLFACTVAVAGVSWSSRADLASTLAQSLIVVLLVGLALVVLTGPITTGGPRLPDLWPASAPLGGVISGASAAIIAYIGFDAVSTLAEEVASDVPGVAVGRATLTAVVVMTVVFLATGWALSGLSGDLTGLDPPQAGFQIVRARLPALSLPLGLVTGLALGMSSSLVCMSSSARILFAMARDGHLPEPLSRVHPRMRSPVVAVLTVAVLATSLAFWALPHADLLGGLVSFGALSGFLLVNLSVIASYGLRGGSRRWLRHWILPALGTAVIVYILSGIQTDALQLGAAWTLAGAVLFVLMRWNRQRRHSFEANSKHRPF